MLLHAICYSAFESIWRRTQGGGHLKRFYEKYIRRWLLGLSSRVFFTVLNLTVACLVGRFIKNFTWFETGMFVLSVELFWDMSFGMYMDIGRRYPPTDEEIGEYKNTPLNFVLDWMFPKSMKYGKTYDFIQMWFRYTWPLIVMPIFCGMSWWILILGLMVAISYWFGWILYEKMGFIVDDAPTCLSEYLAGAFAGLMWIVC